MGETLGAAYSWSKLGVSANASADIDAIWLLPSHKVVNALNPVRLRRVNDVIVLYIKSLCAHCVEFATWESLVRH